jgi:hypothetical protein
LEGLASVGFQGGVLTERGIDVELDVGDLEHQQDLEYEQENYVKLLLDELVIVSEEPPVEQVPLLLYTSNLVFVWSSF